MAGPTLSHILDPRPPADAERLQHHHQQQSFSQPPSDAHGMVVAPISNNFSHQAQTASPPTPNSSGQFNTSPANGASRSNQDASNLYACRDCGRSYSRPEHLVRHVQTHTLGRRFICDICQKSFARKDLLRRHVANHANDTPAKRRKLASSPGKGRVSYACKACASARVKCDEEKPCKRCVSRNVTCESSEAGSNAAMHLVNLSSKAHSADVQPGSSVGQHVYGGSARDSSSPSSYYGVNPGEDSVTSNPSTTKRTPTSQPTPLRHDDQQLPTPDGMPEPPMPPQMFPHPTGYLQEPNVLDANRMPFFDFLRDVLYDQPFDATRTIDPQGIGALDFCSDNNMELTDMDFGLLDYWNLDGVADATMLRQQLQTPGLPESTTEISQIRTSLVKVWTESPWRWQPRTIDTGYGQLGDVPLSSRDTQNIKLKGNERMSREKLDLPCRDKVLAIVLGACKPTNTTHRVASSFPSVDMMDTMIHIFLASHACQVSGWIHFPTCKFSEQWPEWIAATVAAGAVATSIPTMRKFGYSVQEAIRITLINRFEEDNRAIKDLGLLQTYVLWEDVSLWSGNRRKMEIAECHLAIPVTMMRYRGKFQRSYYPVIDVKPEDQGEVLEEKWKSWSEKEQWKRLIFHCYMREAQMSMTALTNPCMTYSELTLPFPEAKELWFAKSATEWKAHYLQRNIVQSKRAPCVGDVLRDVHLLRANENRLDIQFAISIYLYGYWAMILEYRQMCGIHKSRSYTTNMGNTASLLLSSRHQELVKDLQNFQLIASDWAAVSPQEHFVLNVLLMNLHISLDDLQLFSGKEGEEQARRIYPILQQWVASPDSRSAAWYAGQVLRYAKMFPKDHIKGFYAVAIHHAALTLWTYGVVGRANRRAPFSSQAAYENIYLDGPDSLAVQRFIGFEQGQPMIRGPEKGNKPPTESPIRDTRLCMDITQEILESNASLGKSAMPPIAEGLCVLIKQLGNAAWAVGLG